MSQEIDLKPSFCPRKYRITFLTIIAVFLSTVLISMSIIINDPEVHYDKTWFIGSIIFNIVVMLYLIYLIYVSRKVKSILECNKTLDPSKQIKWTSPSFTLCFYSCVSLFLIAFGLSSIGHNEITNEDPEYVDSILYYYKDLVNDNIAIFSVLIGFIVLLLVVSDYLFC